MASAQPPPFNPRPLLSPAPAVLPGPTADSGGASFPPLDTHTLRIFSTFVSRPGRRKNRYIGLSYVDHTEILRLDSGMLNPRLEPRVPWLGQQLVEQEDPHLWEEQTRIWKENQHCFRAALNNLRTYYNQSEDGEPRAPGSWHSPHSGGWSWVHLSHRSIATRLWAQSAPKPEEPAGILTRYHLYSL